MTGTVFMPSAFQFKQGKNWIFVTDFIWMNDKWSDFNLFSMGKVFFLFLQDFANLFVYICRFSLYKITVL